MTIGELGFGDRFNLSFAFFLCINKKSFGGRVFLDVDWFGRDQKVLFQPMILQRLLE